MNRIQRKIFSAICLLTLICSGWVTVSYTQYPSVFLDELEILINEPVTDELIRLLQTNMSARNGLDEEIHNTNHIIQSLFTEYGYFAAEIHPNEVGDTIFVRPGSRATIVSVTVEPESMPVHREVLSRSGFIVGDYFSTRLIETWIRETLTAMEYRGYPMSAIVLDSLSVDMTEPPGVQLHLSLHHVEKVTLHTIRIEGNQETRDRIIMRQAGVFPGDEFSRSRIDNIRPRLLRSGLFRSVAEPNVFMDKQGGSLLISVEESRFNSFDGIIGYIPEPEGGGYLTGLAHITMRNIFGTMRRFEARWQRETRLTQDMLFRYREPYVAGLPISTSLGFRQRQQDTTFVRTQTRLTADAEIFRTITVGFSYEYERVIPSETISPSPVRNSRSHILGFEVAYDSRDDAVVPRNGLLYSTEYQTGRVRRVTGSGNVDDTLHRFLIDFMMYFPVSFNHVLYIGLHGRESRLTQYQESDLFRLGGTRSLRGYREGQFIGSRTGWTNSEYRFMAGRRSYVFGFFDAGYYLYPSPNEGSPGHDQFLFGYGGGLQVETTIGLISLGFGFGKGDTFSTGKIHIGVINEF
jgi:outer membrane protein assembly factor BamA